MPHLNQCGLRADLRHPVVLLTDLGRVRDFMLEPEYTQEESTADAVRQMQMMAYHLKTPAESGFRFQIILGTRRKCFCKQYPSLQKRQIRDHYNNRPRNSTGLVYW
jgi:hypothetical protein